jgi:hypothetical protein
VEGVFTAGGTDLDAFAAQRLTDVLFNLVAGGPLASAFIPTFTGFLTHDYQAGAWRLASGVLNLVLLALRAVNAPARPLAPAPSEHGYDIAFAALRQCLPGLSERQMPTALRILADELAR